MSYLLLSLGLRTDFARASSQKAAVLATCFDCAHDYCVYFGNLDEPLEHENRHPESIFSILLELEVDRSAGTQIHGQ